MESIIVDIKRKNAFIGVVMPIKVLLDGVEVTRIKSGGSFRLELPVKTANLTFSMVGNDFTDGMNKVVLIEPEKCERGFVSIELSVRPQGFMGFKSYITTDVQYF